MGRNIKASSILVLSRFNSNSIVSTSGGEVANDNIGTGVGINAIRIRRRYWSRENYIFNKNSVAYIGVDAPKGGVHYSYVLNREVLTIHGLDQPGAAVIVNGTSLCGIPPSFTLPVNSAVARYLNIFDSLASDEGSISQLLYHMQHTSQCPKHEIRNNNRRLQHQVDSLAKKQLEST